MIGILRRVERRPKFVATVLSCAVLAAIGYCDSLVGTRITVSYIYLAPVALATWYAGRWSGLAISLVAAAVWALANPQVPAWGGRSMLDLWNAASLLVFYVTVSLLLSALRSSLDRLKGLAKVDSLTGLANRRAFLEVAEIERRRSIRSGNAFAVAFVDLDNFKAVNDGFGHDVGDAVLQEVGRIMLGSLRATDCACRFGGDEFAVLLPATDREKAKTVLEKLHDAIKSSMELHRWPVTLSIGIAVCEDPTRGIDELLSKADSLMYEAKTSGKNSLKAAVLSARLV